MKQILKKGKVKGSVLFTTTGVMLVLVVFLMSTVVLSTASNRRSYYTYYETQAQYAAQAALDAVTNSAYTDDKFHEWITTQVTTSTDRLPITVDFSNSHIQFTNNNDSIVCYVEKADPNYVWDDVTQAVHEQQAWKITATASVGNGKNASTYTISNYLYENFRVEDPATLNTVENAANNTVYSYTPPGATPSTSNGSLLNAIYALGGNTGSNNFVSLGPQYYGMNFIPVGRTRYEAEVAGGGSQYVTISNNNHAVGNVRFVSSILNKVEFSVTFQKYKEGAVYYGNVMSQNAGTHGMYWSASMDNDQLATNWAYTDLPYVYVDGNLADVDGGGIGIGYQADGNPGNVPVNLYAGAFNAFAANQRADVTGDVYLYDPALDSVWTCQTAKSSHLMMFASNNVGHANTQYNWASRNSVLGGNIVCNNNSLTLGNDQGMFIQGDVIFTNPNGLLFFANKTTVLGNVYCAGTIGGLENLTCDNIVVQGADAIAQYSDPAYSAEYYAGTTYVQQSMMPFSMRLDEIHERYRRWDLQALDAATAQQKAADDPLIAESIAAGHTWEIDTITLTDENSVPVTQEVTIEIDNNDPRYDWSNAQWGPDGFPKQQITVLQVVGYNTTSSSTTYYVPATSPITGSGFIPKYEPMSRATAASVSTGDAKYKLEDSVSFRTLMSPSAVEYNSSSKPDYRTNVPIYSHDGTGAESVDKVDCYVINKDCTIDLNQGYNQSTILIDPRMNGNTDSNPLFVLIKGTSVQNCGATILINNTASYSPSYDNAVSYASDTANGNVYYAGRREVFIFIENGFTTNAQTFKLYCTGARSQFANNNFRVVSNPIYPSSSAFGSVPADLKYSYELVPNVVIFGENNGTITFNNAAFINAEMIMPNTTVKNPNGSLYKAQITYREEVNSVPYTCSDACGGMGSMFVSGYDGGTNNIMVAYIGDGNRDINPTYSVSTSSPSRYSNKLGEDYNDYFSNDHRGAY
ncbi:MAG: hypothetical protein MJ071_01100 [Oscillospiraceae bacterium]|nr:hypothetical protein [Oscillospiraceae bacterium]